MKVLTVGIIAIAILAVLSAGCTSQQQTPPTTATAQPLVPTTTAQPALPQELAGNWQLTSMGVQEGTAITYPTTVITLVFNPDATVSGNGGCNNYNGPYTLTGAVTDKGSGITIGPLTSTKMYCQTTSEQENTYMNMLEDTMAYDVDSATKLVLTGKSQNVLIFQRPSAIPKQTEGMLPA